MKEQLTELEKISNHETFKHMFLVQQLILFLTNEMNVRAMRHDVSKLCSPEIECFATHYDSLSRVEYGDSDYARHLEDLKTAIIHHYANNRHHPEHFENGIEGMNLIDLVEMICDWVASSNRMKDGGNPYKSLKIGAKRFNIEPQLEKILKNTIDVMCEIKK